ncbi:DJ-1/PfpI family protein [Serratia fonticola]|uniref:DJ-1/PfpI family protein n=1 Tax=Serratia fonticola TaxID=47917 RepID=UPI0024DE6E04|nr:DJ-1/PfpI family protein [Serratia fonticola]MDK2375051.1 DJ-1/PfpI family protein [Serratia fonticola]
MDRREFIVKSALALIASDFGAGASSSLFASANANNHITTPLMKHDKPTLAFVLYHGMTPLDIIGPASVLWDQNINVEFVAHDLQPFKTEHNFVQFYPSTTFDHLDHADILCVTGTGNPYAHLQDNKMLDWINKVGSKAEWVTSVCTGSILLGAAGLMRGYRAATHWAMMEELKAYGAIPVDERVVIDRNRISGGGVTAGIDFGLTLRERLTGRYSAEMAQLLIQYDPQPPFNSGTPKTAPANVTEDIRKIILESVEEETPDWQLRVKESAARSKQYKLREDK